MRLVYRRELAAGDVVEVQAYDAPVGPHAAVAVAVTHDASRGVTASVELTVDELESVGRVFARLVAENRAQVVPLRRPGPGRPSAS